MDDKQLYVVCDFGTTVFKTLVLEVESQTDMRVVGISEVPASGFKDGDFIDIDAGRNAIKRMIKKAESDADVDISGIYYTISGSHLRFMFARSQQQIEFGPRAISFADTQEVIEKTKTLSIPYDHSILVVSPVSYSVDGIRGVFNPIDRVASHLEVEACIITGSRSITDNIEQTISSADLDSAGWSIDTLAASRALLSAEEKQEGIALIDIGGHETNWAIFNNGSLAGFGRVPWGGEHLTADLAHGLKRTEDEAENIKCENGLVLRSLAEDVDTDVLFKDSEIEPSFGIIAAILEPRLEEIFRLVQKEMGHTGQSGHIKNGIVITGGGSRCNGTSLLCREVFGMKCETRYLPDFLSAEKKLIGRQWASVIGLALGIFADGANHVATEIHEEENTGKSGGFLRKFFNK